MNERREEQDHKPGRHGDPLAEEAGLKGEIEEESGAHLEGTTEEGADDIYSDGTMPASPDFSTPSEEKGTDESTT